MSDKPAYVDKFGNQYSAAIITNWTAAARKALGIRPIEEADKAGDAVGQP